MQHRRQIKTALCNTGHLLQRTNKWKLHHAILCNTGHLLRNYKLSSWKQRTIDKKCEHFLLYKPQQTTTNQYKPQQTSKIGLPASITRERFTGPMARAGLSLSYLSLSYLIFNFSVQTAVLQRCVNWLWCDDVTSGHNRDCATVHAVRPRLPK